jgi:hypothetical protein
MPRIEWTPGGALRYLGAPPGAFRLPEARAAAADPAAHRGRSGVPGEPIKFVIEKRRARRPRVPALQRTRLFAGLRRAGHVKLDSTGGVESVPTWRGPRALDVSMVPQSRPSPPAPPEPRLARAPGSGRARPPLLQIFAPEVIGDGGPPRLVWSIEVGAPGRSGASFRVLVDAQDGAIVRAFPLDADVMNRVISDSNNTTHFGTTVRSEGQPPCGIVEADHAYDYVGDVRLLRALSRRDGLPNFSQPVRATVRFCDQPVPCHGTTRTAAPVQRMFFGDGWAVDDVVAHEYTGVTAFSAAHLRKRIGAINESLSDRGRFIDLRTPRPTPPACGGSMARTCRAARFGT